MPVNMDGARGRVKQAAGDLTDDDGVKPDRETDQAGGKIEDAMDVKDGITGDD